MPEPAVFVVAEVIPINLFATERKYIYTSIAEAGKEVGVTEAQSRPTLCKAGKCVRLLNHGKTDCESDQKAFGMKKLIATTPNFSLSMTTLMLVCIRCDKC